MSLNRIPAAADQAPSLPDFAPVPLRARRDGWTAERQRLFIAELRRTCSVSAAARAAGMSRVTAYRLRERPGAEGFAAAWDAAFREAAKAGAAPQDTLWEHAARVESRPKIRNGRKVGVVVKMDNRALIKLFWRLRRLARSGDRRDGNLHENARIGELCKLPAESADGRGMDSTPSLCFRRRA